MLTTDPRIQPALVRAHFEPLHRSTDGLIQVPSRFRSVVDDNGDELGAVSDRYKLVQTADVVSAFDLEAETRGYDMQPREGFYRNGRSKITFDIRNRTYRKSGGDGDITPMLYLENGLGGTNALRGGTGSNIARCGNGLWMGDIIAKDTKRHTSGIDILAFVRFLFDKLDERIERDLHLIEAARATRFNFTDELTKKVGESAPKRLLPQFREIIQRNRRIQGDTVWAMLQAITELSTHHMRERRDGTHVWSADEWTRTNVRRISENYALVG
jgi:hypothetical protein